MAAYIGPDGDLAYGVRAEIHAWCRRAMYAGLDGCKILGGGGEGGEAGDRPWDIAVGGSRRLSRLAH